jgi:hypothetical protein
MSTFFTRLLFIAPVALLLMVAFAVAWLVEVMGDLASGFSRSEKAS